MMNDPGAEGERFEWLLPAAAGANNSPRYLHLQNAPIQLLN